mmetsp:Transcript_32461/g.41694  ORF Transcript_32461/g.41694 Transcript_32461/m.41694 type:complete len:206 (+) Transcript_32461:39-656(+)
MEIHCDIPQDQAIRAQRKNDQLGGVSKPRKGLKNRDPNKLVTNNSDGVVKPQQASIVIKSDNKLKPKLGEKNHKLQSNKTSSKSKSHSRPIIFSDHEDIEFSAGRLGHEEEAYLSKQRNNSIPLDFPFFESSPSSTKKIEKVSKKKRVKLEKQEENEFKQQTLIDEDEIDAILNNVDIIQREKQNVNQKDQDFPICDVEFDFDLL